MSDSEKRFPFFAIGGIFVCKEDENDMQNMQDGHVTYGGNTLSIRTRHRPVPCAIDGKNGTMNAGKSISGAAGTGDKTDPIKRMPGVKRSGSLLKQERALFCESKTPALLWLFPVAGKDFRTPKQQFGIKHGSLRVGRPVLVAAVQLFQHDAGALVAHGKGWLLNFRNGGIVKQVKLRQRTKRDERNILRDGKPGIVNSANCANGHHVVGAEDGGYLRLLLEDVFGEVVPAIHFEIPIQDIVAADFYIVAG